MNKSRDILLAFCIAAGVLVLYLLVSSQSTLWDRDEPRFARATVEMVESGNYLYPTFNGSLRPDKPILIYWLMSIPVRLLGPTEAACRFCSGLGLAISCLLTFYIGRKLINPAGGLLAAGILGTSLMSIYIGTASTADGTLLPCMLATIAVFVHSIEKGPKWYHTVFMGATLGLALLTKGPVGLLPALVILVTFLLHRGREVSGKKYVVPVIIAIVIAVGLFLAWAIPANNATNGEFAKIGLGKHVMSRATSAMEGHGGKGLKWLLSLPYYIPMIIMFFFPWIMHLPGGINALCGKRIGGTFERSLYWGWMLSVFVLMSMVATKLPHYILFMWPAMSLLTARTLIAFRDGLLNDKDIMWLRRGAWFFGTIAFGMVAALFAAGWILQTTMLKIAGVVAGIILLTVSVLAIKRQNANQFLQTSRIIFVGIALFLLAVAFGVLPGIEKLKFAPKLAQEIRNQTSTDIPVFTCDYGEPSLNFYLGRKITHLQPDQVLLWAKEAQPAALVITRKTLDAIEEKSGTLSLQNVYTFKGINYSKGKPIEILLFKRSGSENK